MAYNGCGVQVVYESGSVYGESKKNGKDQESIQPSNTQDPGYQMESDNFTIRHRNREPRGQPFRSR